MSIFKEDQVKPGSGAF